MKNFKKKVLSTAAAAALLLGTAPTWASANNGNSGKQSVPQGTSQAVLNNADYSGNMNVKTKISVDIIMKTHQNTQLKNYIKSTVTPGNSNYRKYLSTDQFVQKFAPSSKEIQTVTNYLHDFGISSKVYSNHLVITASGTVGEFNKALNVHIQNAKLNGEKFHASKTAPELPTNVASDILTILGVSNYSHFHSDAHKRAVKINSSSPQGPLALDPQDLINHYNVKPLYDQGANGSGQSIGVVSLAEFNPQDAYSFWQAEGIKVKSNRIHVNQIDGGSGWAGYDETTLDVEQSGALAPMANINVYVGPNTDTGFVDAFANAISSNQIQQLSVSWGESETGIIKLVRENKESPSYAQVFNELYMEAATQGISTFASSGDAGAYDATRYPGTYQLSVDNPADSPYITAAGGTTLPWHVTTSTGVKISVSKERAWGWDYLYNFFDSLGLNNPKGWAADYFVGGGGGFSTLFSTPDYQKGVSGVNSYSAIKYWNPSTQFKTVKRLNPPKLVSGNGSGRNLPDLSMNADPYTGYKIYLSAPGNPGQDAGWAVYGGTSFVAPQLNGLSALINSADNTQIGFWNPQIYRFAQTSHSPFNPLNATGKTNDNIFYSGTKGTIYNQATGLGVPNVADLAKQFAGK